MADEVAISGRPYERVANLTAPTPTFDNDRKTMALKASWKVPSNLTAKTNPRRAESLSSWFGMYATTPQLAQTANLRKFGGDGHYGSVPTTGANITSNEYTFDVARFYPFSASGPRLTSLYVVADPYNSAGSADWANKATASTSMLKPVAPTISAPAFDDGSGHVSCTVKSTATSGARHWHSTSVRRDCFDSQTGNTVSATYTTSSASYDVPSVDVAGVDTIQGSRYWRYVVTATARGLAGDSGAATASLYVAQPKVPTISSFRVAGTSANSKVSISLSTNATKEHPVTGMRLQVLRSSPYTTAAQAVADLQGVGWEDMDVVDDGQCTCLVTEVSEVRPDVDTRTWVRVKVWDLSETRGHLHNWSAPVRLQTLETSTPTATNDKCGIISVTPAKNGTSASVRIGWSEDTTNTGTELSWSDSPNAWSSTDSPSTATFEGNGSASTDRSWKRERTVTLSDLTPGTTYWVRARRYRTSGSNTTYTAYSKAVSVKPQGAENDRCAIVRATPGSDGTTGTVIVGFTEDSANTGTELTWSPDPNAWWSNVQPSLLTATWKDSSSQSASWGGTATVYLRDLEPATTYYIRARRYLESGGSTTYSPMSKVYSMRTPEQTVAEAANDRIGIVSVAAGDDGTSADLAIGWSEDTHYDGTEVTWSDREDAWESTEQPSSFQATWADKKSQSASWKSTQTVHVEGLEQGTKYWFRARRYNADATSGWSAAVTLIPAVQPTSVTLVAPAWVERGRAVSLTWTYGGGSEQTAWRVMHGNVTVASGDDPVTGCVVDATRFAQLTEGLDSYDLTVQVSTGGDFAESASATVGIADRPTLSVSDAEVTAQPAALALACSSERASVAIIVTAAGAMGDTPSGTRTQAYGDTVWSAVVRPVWSDGAATVIAPTGLDLWGGCRYLVEAVATDEVTGLSSDTAMGVLTIDWARPAPEPGEAVVTPMDVTDEMGRRTLKCSILLVAPEDGASTDVYDVYRVTSGGADLVASGIPFGTTIEDQYATLGEASYRVCTRTADGDLDWLDFPYELKCGSMLRVDWDGGYVELPYNVAMQDSYEKDFEGVRDLTGETEGYWNSGATHRQSLSTDVIKIGSAQTVESLRRLARYAGPTFVRTPDGCAYQANVDVSGIDSSYNSMAVAVALDATEVALTDEFRVKLEGD